MIEKVKPGLFIAGRPDHYRIVYPIKKDLDKGYSWDNINLKHLLIGSWGRFKMLLIILGLLWFFIGTYVHDTKVCRELVEDPCKFCKEDRCLLNYSKVEGANLIYQDFNNLEKEEIELSWQG